MSKEHKNRILFLCTGNSARSQMAEALLKQKAGDKFEVHSAGTHPEAIDPRTKAVLSQYGLNSEGLSSNNINEFSGQSFDYVITLCDHANTECRSYPGAGKQYAWDLPDPKTRSGNKPFVNSLDEINNRLSMFLLVEEKTAALRSNVVLNDQGSGAKKLDVEGDTQEQTTKFEPLAFYKSLTDEIRLKSLMLTYFHGELCVCELMTALAEESQPKVSRNLAVLKKAGIITARKHGQWVFYRLNPTLPLWIKTVLAQTTENNISMIDIELQRLAEMKNRPDKDSFCK